LNEIAATPGLAGLVLRDTAAPGYANPGDANDFVMWGMADFGYTPEMRLAFLRQEGVDPVDLPVNSYVGNVDLNLPFFGDGGLGPRHIEVDGQWVQDRSFVTPAQKWNALRYAANARLLAELFTGLKSSRPDLPLLIRDRTSAGFSPSGWYASWDKPDALPRRPSFEYREGTTPPTTLQVARSQSKSVLLTVTHVIAEGPPPPGSPEPEVKPDSPQALARC
jgi:hypothetical protein